MASAPRRFKPIPVTTATTEPPVKSAASARWKLTVALVVVLAAFLIGYKLTPATSTVAPSPSALTSAAPVTIPELAPLPPTLHQEQEIQMVGEGGHWVPMGKLKKGDQVWHNGRWLVVKSIKHETVTETREVEVPVKPATPKSGEETSLDLDLSQGGDTFDETLIVPASQAALLTDGTVKVAKQLQSGDKVYMSGEHIALVKKAKTKWYTPPPPQEPDANGNVTSRVIGTIKRMTDRILYLHTDKETLGTTPEHPFSIEGKGWVQAGQLQQGDRIKTQDGHTVIVESLEVKAERKMVYNLKVEGTENYFVGKNRMLVHNGGDCVPTLSEAKKLLGQWAEDPLKGTRAASLRYHFGEHGEEVGAKDVWQYMRKAEGFKQNLRGAGKAFLDGGKTRYMKNGKYIILNGEGNIISFGLQRR